MADRFTAEKFQWLEQITFDKHAEGRGDAVRVGFAISTFINRKTGEAWPGLDHLAGVLGTNEKTVAQATWLAAGGPAAVAAIEPHDYGVLAATTAFGKTVVGAYLVGSKGTTKHAVFLGLTVTVTHTLGVFALATLVAGGFLFEVEVAEVFLIQIVSQIHGEFLSISRKLRSSG